jgi:4-diphosphocytidyl-2-C-methyl-D-erythritol kinase
MSQYNSINLTQQSTTSHWPCPAKLNLFLHIVGRRDNGYHNLQSVFQILDIADDLAITLEPELSQNSEIKFSCDNTDLSGDDNLVVKAAKKLQDYAAENLNRHQLGAKLHLTKILPVGGGMGGGSSNCATTLVALNYLWQLGLSIKQLAELGISLGADVPIFVLGQTAFVEGIGEIISPIKAPTAHYLIIQPQVHISTQKIFSDPLLTRDNKIIRIRDLDIGALPFKGKNTMQDVVLNNYPEVEKALNWLQQFNKNARLTGTGSCVFLGFDNEREMSKIASQCELTHFTAKGLNVSPLHIKMHKLESVS